MHTMVLTYFWKKKTKTDKSLLLAVKEAAAMTARLEVRIHRPPLRYH